MPRDFSANTTAWRKISRICVTFRERFANVSSYISPSLLYDKYHGYNAIGSFRNFCDTASIPLLPLPNRSA